MNYVQNNQGPGFDLEARFLGFVMKKGQIKYLRVAVAQDELQIKLSKQARASLLTATLHGTALQPWDYIQVVGETKFDPKSGDIKLKAYQIIKQESRGCETISEGISETINGTINEAFFAPSIPQSLQPKPPSSRKIRLLVCHKSGCIKKGGKKQLQAIENILRDRGLEDRFVIQETGCLGKCSMAPNMVLMPGKKRLSGMKPEAIVDLLESLKST